MRSHLMVILNLTVRANSNEKLHGRLSAYPAVKLAMLRAEI